MNSSLAKALVNPQLATLPLFPAMYGWWLLQYRLGLEAQPDRAKSDAPRAIDRVSMREFRTIFRKGSPAIITDIVPTWKAFSTWTPEYFKKVAGDKEVRVLTSTSADRDFGVAYEENRFEVMKLRDLIDIVFFKPPTDKRYYLWGDPGWDGWDPLTDDVQIPHFDNHEFSETGSGIWIGQAENITSLHYDLWHGALAQLRGRKKVIMFPPGEGAKLAATSPFSDKPCQTDLPKHCMEADRKKFPNVDSAVRYEAILEPGEMLYIPLYWWHEVQSIDPGISIPLRFDPLWTELVHPAVLPIAYLTTIKPILKHLKGSP